MIVNGDCLEKMREMEANSIDCILTDPPYGIFMMSKNWDKGIPGVEFWQEALRVCKPGATMLAFGGTRTYHRLTCAIEDAGWQIRDCIMYIYGSGFPKSHNKFGLDGYGTALKPAVEPIVMCMKPLDGTFAQNAEKWGVGGINIDACRIGTDDTRNPNSYAMTSKGISGGGFASGQMSYAKKVTSGSACGRWPANVLFDEEAVALLDEQSGFSKSSAGNKSEKSTTAHGYEGGWKPMTRTYRADSGGASRFFYCAKASKRERGEGNNHPTVKPIKLLEYLLKLIMPPSPDAIVLDPFAGSGSTLVAANNLGMNATGIEIDKDYCEIAKKRIEFVSSNICEKDCING